MRELLARHPSHLLAELRDRLAAQGASEKVELDGAIRIVVSHRENLGADVDGDRQLLQEFADEARVQGFISAALPARKFPQSLEVNALLPPGQEKTAGALQDGSGNDQACHRRVRRSRFVDAVGAPATIVPFSAGGVATMSGR